MKHLLRTMAVALIAGAMLLGSSWGQPAGAAELFIMTSNVDHAWIAQRLGGDLVKTYTPHKGYQEPELTWVDEIFPSWVIRGARADGYVRYGLYADVWADTLIDAAGNPRIKPGSLGYLDPTEGIEVLEIPAGAVDRRQGDLHVFGNPHYLLDPANAVPIARNTAAWLIGLMPDQQSVIEANLQGFLSELDGKMREWAAKAAPLKGKTIATYHRTWSYFAKRYGLNVVGVIEPKPGIEPTPRDLDVLVNAMKASKTNVVIKAPVYSDKWPNYVGEQVGYPITIRTLGAHVGAEEQIKTYFDLFDYLIDNLLDLYGLK
jgi:ABC-type Zn uptake system ZnuABC Zn-binding protein ZnuA